MRVNRYLPNQSAKLSLFKHISQSYFKINNMDNLLTLLIRALSIFYLIYFNQFRYQTN